ncbi:uncharacterized protein [Physcomitrium patens]|uniref:uncharacterized protein isoform X2 n=1 Tax=Physcomitrium patens TaxID=3218 RepID=UPI003CCD6DF8
MRDGLIHRIWSSNKLHQPDALIPVLQAHEVSCWGSKSALMAAVGVSCTFSSSTTSSEDKSLKPPDSHPFIRSSDNLESIWKRSFPHFFAVVNLAIIFPFCKGEQDPRFFKLMYDLIR